ncbi:MAG: 3-deoxy-7-phosphoheptulonate synthase [Phycisphaerae bacterium]|jgi:3-deoxy-7-phosphoheptulonate synthase
MIVVMNPSCTAEHTDNVVALLDRMGLTGCVIEGASQKVVEVLGGNGEVDPTALQNAPMVDRVLDSAEPILAGSRKPDEDTAALPIGATAVLGGKKLGIIAGPCAVESRDQLLDIAHAVKDAGAVALRGGAYKPRTSPYSFQGHAQKGLEWLAEAREQTGLAIVTEVMRCEHVPRVAEFADVLQIGSRNMHHTHLLATVGKQSKPVLLKRGWCSTVDEFLSSAEYIMLAGNRNVILCERGIRTHETYVRNTLALAVVPELKRRSILPVVVDPSHGTGHDYLVTPMSNAAVACGADGLLIEVHSNPSRAWSDGCQSLDLKQFASLMAGLEPIAQACGREL